MDYHKLVGMVAPEKREILSNRFVDMILLSKSDDKMPRHLANAILYHWQNNILTTESGIAVLLEAAVLLEPDKAAGVFIELELISVAEQIKAEAAKT